MAKVSFPSTPAIRLLKSAGVPFTLHSYAYEDHGGTEAASKELGVEEHAVIKTLVMEDETSRPLIVLMHGDRQVSTKALARTLGVKSDSTCSPSVAERHSGYKVGGTSPFGTRKALPIYMEESISALPRIYINAGARGLLACIAPSDLIKVLKPTPVQVAI